MRLLPAGHRGLLAECDDLAEVMALHQALAAHRPAGVVDLVPAARTLLLAFDERVTSHGRLADIVEAVDVDSSHAAATPAGSVTIEVVYGGEDLAEVASLTGLSVDEVVRRHTAAEYVVAFTGFAPGFAYIAGGDPALVVPRRPTPRTQVPAGSVALAGEFTGIYPRQGPGGWQLVGCTNAPLWDLGRTPPALLTPGTSVRFEAVDPR
ncbi:MAG: allophanate hydrolase subunit 1 [Dermatophilaceae bacterium]|nr:allophanate hydrolase subunit 1 [Dermatophilaceae bacterium]